MENFNYQIHGRNEGDSLEQLEFNCESNFINRSDFTSSDVEQVLMEAHESILGTMEPIGGCQDANSFLNPINDILGDICEFNKTFNGTNTMAVGSQQVQQANPNTLSALNCNWQMTEPPSYIGVSTTSNNQDNIANDSGFFNISSGSDGQLLLPENTGDYPNPDCSFLGVDYAASFNQLFQNFDHQQLSLMSTPITSVPHSLPSTHNFSDAFLSTIGSLPASTTITPITVEERQIGHRTLSPVQQEVTIEARFVADRNTKRNQSDSENFAPMSAHTSHVLQAQHYVPQRYEDGTRTQNCGIKRKSLFGLESGSQTGPVPTQQHKVIAVLNQNQCSQVVASLPICGSVPNQNMCMVSQMTQSPPSNNTNSFKRMPVLPKNRFNWTAVFPRKHFIHPPEMIIMHPLRTRKLMASRRIVPTGTAIDLSEYFDTSSISIPMIRDRPRTDAKNEHRRKQKLNIIPGSENFIFEIQKNDEKDSCYNVSVASTEQSSLERDPYPETELPELEEIFKRKKKSSVSTSNGKRSNVGPPIIAGPPQKKNCINNVLTHISVQESSTSFEEKISLPIAIRQGRSKISVDQIDTSSESDSLESEESMTLGGKSLKCLKCMKLFKTTRSLAIHTKRCTATPRETYSGTIHSSNGSLSNDLQNDLLKIEKNQEESKLLDGHSTSLEDTDYSKRLKMIVTSDEMKARPITRSQTRRSTGRVIRSATTTKRSK